MGKIIGPFDVTWGSNTLADVGEVSLDYDIDVESFTTVQHNRFEVDGGILAKATITLLRSDIPALAAVLPQFFVAQGSDMSTGETVDSSVGAIDLAAQCDEPTYNDLEIVSCGDPGQTMRLVNARTRISDVENSDKLRSVMVDFIGEPAGGVAALQFFESGGIS